MQVRPASDDLAGLGDLVHQYRSEKHTAKGCQLLLGRAHAGLLRLAQLIYAAAQADFAVIEHHGLARVSRALRVIEDGAVTCFFQGAGLVALAITHAQRSTAQGAQVTIEVDPVDLGSEQGAEENSGCSYLGRPPARCFQVFDQHAPRLFTCVLQAANAQA